ncbi:MAG: sigma-54 dependent transcriptional regulator [Acidobacteriota bacterium]|nr:sigma-54 dependent transcriptional regulator [Acidobacteriota bacterium]
MSKVSVPGLIVAPSQAESFVDDNVNLRAELSVRYDFSRLVGNSNAMRAVYEQIAQVASSNTTVLVTGESGTGKELVAHALHINSARSDGAFVKVNCAALPEDLIESELFGHERGAFTDAHQQRLGRFELASGGTLFLDEIGELSQSAQAKLLRVLQTREFERVGGTETLSTDARLIAATNCDLEKEIEAGRFRADLYYRLNIFPIPMPPLRERKEDIPLMVDHFLARLNEERGGKIRRLSPIAFDSMLDYDWPGNVRELQNAIERAFVMAESGVVHHYHLPQPVPQAMLPSAENSQAEGFDLFEAVDAYEKDLICHALRATRGKRNQAAKLLRVSERALAYKVRKHGIDHLEFRGE